MRRPKMKPTLLILLFLSFTLAGAVDSFDYHCANITLLQDKQVQAELRISAAQRAQMNKYADAHLARIDAYRKKVGNGAPDMKVVAGYMADLKAKVVGALSKTQMIRLRELNLQAAGLMALLDPVVAKKIGMSDAQYSKFKKTYLDGKNSAAGVLKNALAPLDAKYNKLAAPYKGKEREHQKELADLQRKFLAEAKQIEDRLKPRLDAITRSTEKKLVGQITAKQKATWKSLEGKPFTPKK